MSLIFLSHSSADEREAVALKQWLKDNGWDDVFLDVDPERGLIAGERWQEALKRAADRCEAVVFIVSPAWAKSKWCLAEFLLAKSLNKRIFGVVIKSVVFSELPTELTAEWQLCHLGGQGTTATIACLHREQPIKVAFLAEGLGRLKAGLHTAGLHADFFSWPPKTDLERAPYRGLEPLETADAAVFFGRDLEILQGLDKLRGIRALGTETLFIILGASGAGKSSFLRAGLLPRLARDDRHFLPLLPIRPERSPLFGERGLAYVIHETNKRLNLQPATLGGVKDALSQGAEGFLSLMRNIQSAARARLVGLPDDAPPPTLVLSIDQAEELFNADSQVNSRECDETHVFLELIGMALRTSLTEDQGSKCVPVIIMFTIRSDRYEPLQMAPELAGLKSVVFDALKPMPRAQFKEVITGPALRATASTMRQLAVHPELVSRLLNDCDQQGGDSLPLLGLTLARLYREFGSDGDLTIDEYQKMGGMANIIKNEVESILSADPATRQIQLERLHDAFIPALVTINPESDQPIRRVALMSDLPAESRPLVHALIDKRLLLSDLRGGHSVIEVAHESLFRQWDVLVNWLREERSDLLEVDRLEQAASAWMINDKREDWLIGGERLERAEMLATKPRYSRRLEGSCEFLLASRHWEKQKRKEEERLRNEKLDAEITARQEAQLAANRSKRQARKLRIWFANTLIALIIAMFFFFDAQKEKNKALAAFREATGLRLATQSIEMLEDKRPGNIERALLQLLAADKLVAHTKRSMGLLTALIEENNIKKTWSTNRNITTAAFSPDGTQVVTINVDGTLHLWNTQTGELFGSLLQVPKSKYITFGPFQGLRPAINSVAFSPDGSRLVLGGIDKTLHLWDVKTRKPLGTPLQGHEGSVTSVAFSPDGTRLVSGSVDGTLRLWDAKTGQPLGTPLQGHEDSVTSVAFSPDGTRLVSGSDDYTLRLWDVKTGEPIGTPWEHEGWVTSVAFSPDGTRLVSGSDDKTLRLWDTKTGQPLGAPLRGHGDSVTSVAFSPDGTRLVSGSDDKTLRLWDTKTGQPLGAPLRGHGDSVTSVAFSQDGMHLLSASKNGTLYLRYAKTDQPLGAPLQGHEDSVTSVAFSPDGTRLVSGSVDGTLRLWDAKTGQPLGTPLQGHEDSVTSVAFSPDGTRLVSGSDDKTLRLWDVKTGEPLGAPLRGHGDSVTSVAFSPDGTRLVSGSDDKTLRLWDTKTGQPLGAPLRGHGNSVTSVAFSPDGTRLVSGSVDRTLRLWDAKTGQPLGTLLQGHESRVTSVAFSPDGTRLVSSSTDKTLRLWDTKTGHPLGTPWEHEGWVMSVAFSPDGTLLVSGSVDRTLRLWDAKTGQPLGTLLQGHESRVTSVAFSPDGTHIVSGSWDNTLRLWPAPKIWPDLLCAKLTRNMSYQEWYDWISPEIYYIYQCPSLLIPPDDPAGLAPIKPDTATPLS